MVLGAAGLGKSLLGELAANELREEFDVIKLHSARLCSRKALLQNILFELQLPYRGLSEGELRLSILDRLEPNPEFAPGGVFIVVDEAHTLPSKLLEELRLITNFTRDGAPRARLLLIGGMQLEDVLTAPQMESFNQRLAARCYLAPMSRSQTAQYVEHQIAAAGYDTKQFIDDDAIQAVCAASEGVPRLANQIMDHALVLANTVRQSPITVQLIEEAWADLQQLPAPWKSSADVQAEAANEVEFGTLDEDDPEFSSFDIAPSPELAAAIDDELTDVDDQPAQAIGPIESTSEIDLSGFPSEEFGETGESLEVIQGPALTSEDSEQVVGSQFETAWQNEEVSDNPGLEIVINVDDSTADLTAINDSFDDAKEDSHIRSEELEPQPELGLRNYALGDEPEELIKTEEEPVVQPETNFFSAFAPLENEPEPTLNDLATPVDLPEATAQAAEVSEPAEVVEPVSEFAAPEPPANKVVETPNFDVNKIFPEGRHSDGFEHVLSNQTPATEFFEDRPTDEKMIAIEDEQQQYDSMGVWENDPPIDQQIVIGSNTTAALDVFDTAEPIEDDSFVDEPESDEQFFSGFEQPIDQSNEQPINTLPADTEPTDEQFIAQVPVDLSLLDSSPINVGANEPDRGQLLQESQEAVASVESDELKKFQEELVEDHLRRINEFSSNVQLGPSNGSVEEILDETESTPVESTSPGVSQWSADVAAIDAEKESTIQGEIEDVVSQLNFSAFSVEPFSVEQLNPSSTPNQVSELEEDELPPVPQSSVDNQLEDESQDFDDDRDLLIVEEDIPVSGRLADSQQQKTRTTPYSQLFAKLRK